MITIRDFQEEDAPKLWALFFNTVRNVNRRDYTEQQVKAWAQEGFDSQLWLKKMVSIQPFVAVLDGVIVGYSDVQPSGLVDHFFCHHEYQGQGVGRALMTHVLEQAKAKGLTRIYSEVSVTARPFYEHMGFIVVNEQQVEVRGATLTNYVMERRLDKKDV
ncbi:GNAT family N-acetyltransferase [Vibrio jasicida]|jgi:putative acetyltransferase|uniref:GNAT family N-acetyltransferase n=1 Tax=Vibrio jasicida TaxID=766224 RepID=UPI0005EFFE95|nr:GNAT family N-acetyltransferase [Vibrio jasicida]CAH1608296.1 GNAT family N-acetyltransferase [Vibrio jasicida]